jgi:hypothetical protein
MILSLLFYSFTSQAVPLKKIELTREQSAAIKEYNRQNGQMKSIFANKPAPLRPFSEVESAGYLFFSADNDFDSAEAKRTMAKNLPSDVTLVIFTEPGDDVAGLRARYAGMIDASRLKIVEISGARRGFWARDGLPVPVWSKTNELEMVDAHYYHRFEPDTTIAGWFHSYLRRINFYFEGGNFMTNDDGACVTVDNDRSTEIPNEIFTGEYGCKKLVRLPFEKGIGHADESVRFLTTKVVATDSPSYARRLTAEGFDVRLLPRPDRDYETYANALVVNGTAFVPVYDEANDQKALDVYRAAGLKVFPINSDMLSNQGLGSVHCITMTYPKVPFDKLVESLDGRVL